MNFLALNAFNTYLKTMEFMMKGIVAWLLGVPVVVIILLYVTGIF